MVNPVRSVAQYLSNSEIAMRIETAPGTVKRHLENLYAKLGVRNRFEAMAIAKQHLRSNA
jgi:LuxR family maltose regulon positive regulatory protein